MLSMQTSKQCHRHTSCQNLVLTITRPIKYLRTFVPPPQQAAMRISADSMPHTSLLQRSMAVPLNRASQAQPRRQQAEA
jgi:hypothetical protein